MFTFVGYVLRSPIFYNFFSKHWWSHGIWLRSAVFCPLISLKNGLKFASQMKKKERIKYTISQNILTQEKHWLFFECRIWYSQQEKGSEAIELFKKHFSQCMWQCKSSIYEYVNVSSICQSVYLSISLYKLLKF